MKIRSMMGTLVLTVAVVLPITGAEPVVEASKLSALARDAQTPAEHAAVAKQYRLRAESFEAQAAEYEQSAKRRQQAAGPMIHKWPAMAPPAVQKDKQKAVEARRAARESRELAERHLRDSVESLALVR